MASIPIKNYVSKIDQRIKVENSETIAVGSQ